MVKKCINRALVSAQLNMNFLFAVTLNFAVNIPNDSYFIILGNRTSAKLYHDSGYIELLLLENECYEQFHIPVGDKITFSYNWMNKSVDGIRLRRYAGNCNITSFDYNSIKKTILKQFEFELFYNNLTHTHKITQNKNLNVVCFRIYGYINIDLFSLLNWLVANFELTT